jgi:hypothetical protein
MTPHSTRDAGYASTHLLTGTIFALLLVGCGSSSSGGNTDSSSPLPDAQARRDVPVATGGSVGSPEVGTDLPSTGGVGGSLDAGSGTGGAGLDAGYDINTAVPEVGREVQDAQPSDGVGPTDKPIPAANDGALDSISAEGGTNSEANPPTTCQSPVQAVVYPVPGLRRIAWDKNDSLVTGGYFTEGTTTFGGQPLTNQGSADMFIAAVNSSTANATWLFAAGDNLDQYVTGIATSSTGIVGSVGNFTGSLEIVAGSPMVNPASSTMDFIAGVDGTAGTGTWSKSANLGLPAAPGSPTYGRLTAIAGNVGLDYFVVCGAATNNAAQLGVKGATPGGGKDVVVAAVKASDGTVIWAKLFGGALDQVCTSAALDDSGNVLLAGQYAGALDFGSGALTPAPTGNTDEILWVAKFNGSTGALVGAQAFGTSGQIVPNSIAADATGNIVVGGQFSSAFSVGTTQLTPLGNTDAFVMKLTPSLTPVWARRWGGAGYDAFCTGVSTDSKGNVVAAGHFAGTVDVGSGDSVLTAYAPTGPDVLVAGLDGVTGTTTCARHYGDSARTATQGATWVAVNRWATGTAKDRIAVVGSFVSVIDFGPPTTALAGGGAINPFAFLLLDQP